jgi:endonuclease G
VDYTGGFTVWLDCEKRGAVKFQYNAQRDTGDAKRSSRFYLDSKVPARCQQTSTNSYKRSPGDKPTYDRGHLVPANHLDHSADAIKQTNTMTNILPQVASMNRGAWKHTEEIVECYRDIDELLVIGGVLWGNDVSNDFFVSSHGITTPDAFWKVIIRPGRVIAWIIPNSETAKYKVLDNYLVPVRKIEQLTGEKIPVEEFLKDEVPSSSWQIPIGCDRG